MKVTRIKHFDYLTPFEEAENDDELEHIMRLKYPKACSNLEIDAGFFARMVEEVQKFKAWRVVGFTTFEDFCREKLGKTLDEVSEIVAGVKRLQARGIEKPTLKEVLAEAPEMPGQRKRTDLEPRANSTKLDRGSTHVSYLAARLKRDHPEICKRIDAGEFKSVRQAAIAAGIVKVPTAMEVALKAFAKLSTKEKATFIQEIIKSVESSRR